MYTKAEHIPLHLLQPVTGSVFNFMQSFGLFLGQCTISSPIRNFTKISVKFLPHRKRVESCRWSEGHSMENPEQMERLMTSLCRSCDVIITNVSRISDVENRIKDKKLQKHG